VDVPNVMVDTF